MRPQVRQTPLAAQHRITGNAKMPRLKVAALPKHQGLPVHWTPRQRSHRWCRAPPAGLPATPGRQTGTGETTKKGVAMRRLAAALVLSLALLAMMATAAVAQAPHFIRASGSLEANGALTVDFKEAGLGTNQLINYTLTADATATYVCVNRGGGNPSASNKTTVAGPVTASGTFSSGKNGQVTASLTAQPPPSDISCPPGQSLELAQVSYTNIVLTDTTNNVSITVPDVNSGCLLPNVRGACD